MEVLKTEPMVIDNIERAEDEPRDLSIKRKIRHVPPPLDLTKRTLELEQSSLLSPRSPFAQKNLPLRKRAFSWSSHPENLQLSLPQDAYQGEPTVENHCTTGLPSSVSATSLRICNLPTPHTPPTPLPNSAIPVISNRFVFGDTGQMNSHVPLNLSVNNFPSSLLSPAPSHRSSSLSSSREELEMDMVPQENFSHLTQGCEKTEFSSPISNKYSPVWSVFLSGAQIHFILGGGQVTNANSTDSLSRIEAAHHNHYAPNGLHVLRVFKTATSNKDASQLYLRPVLVQQQDIIAIFPSNHPFYVNNKGWCSINPEATFDFYCIPCKGIQEGDVILPPNHPKVSQTLIPFLTEAMQNFDFNDENCEVNQPLSTPSAQSNMKFVYMSPPASPSKKTAMRHQAANSEIAPVSKSRRPMNGFMLFAKYHRLKLIQQFPGKDNRAISVLLGTMWKSLPDMEREKYNADARIQAEERKRIDPDCWKRKRSHSMS